jgi:hypothetical protein
MPTNLKRYSVSFPKEIQEILEKDASFNQRPVANQILWVLDRWYAERKKELDYFRPSPQREGKKEPPVFETPSPLHSEQVSKLHAALDRERS